MTKSRSHTATDFEADAQPVAHAAPWVCVIEDDEGVRQTLCFLLEDAGRATG
jgi:hypothetical protein